MQPRTECQINVIDFAVRLNVFDENYYGKIAGNEVINHSSEKCSAGVSS